MLVLRKHNSGYNGRAIVSFIFGLLLNLMVVFLFFEIALRLFPQIIPLAVLKRMEPDLSSNIAARRNLRLSRDTITVERDDGGPPLHIWKATTSIPRFFEPSIKDDSLTTDEMGFCNPAGLYQKSDLPIIALGDSFTWCTNVRTSDSWVFLLSTDIRVPAYNLGMGGIGVYEYLQLLKKFGIAKKPKWVLLNIYEGNDLRDAVLYKNYDPKPPAPASAPKPSELQSVYHKLQGAGPLRYSYSWNGLLAGTALMYRSWLDRSLPKINFRYEILGPDGAIPFNVSNGDLDEVQYAKELVAGKLSMDIMSDGLEEFVKLARIHKFIPIVTYIPSAHTVYQTSVRFESTELHSLMSRFSAEQRSYFSQKAKNLGYVFVDLVPALQKAAQPVSSGNLLYDANNLHLSRRGQIVVAEALGQFFKDRFRNSTIQRADH